jgi:glycosyltransferase involved in cell wall biosynthesis
VVPAGDPVALAERIALLLNTPGHLRELARQVKTRAERCFTASAAAANYLDILHAAVERSGGRR